jgi:hypothetical protein
MSGFGCKNQGEPWSVRPFERTQSRPSHPFGSLLTESVIAALDPLNTALDALPPPRLVIFPNVEAGAEALTGMMC